MIGLIIKLYLTLWLFSIPATAYSHKMFDTTGDKKYQVLLIVSTGVFISIVGVGAYALITWII